MSKNYWRGRLNKGLKEDVAQFISSLSEDKRLVETDITVIAAHNLMLHKQGYLSMEDLVKILNGLVEIQAEWKSGRLDLNPSYVDIHPIIEKRIIELYGLEVGGKTHLAKSRNDQVMADIRIYTRNQLIEISKLLMDLINALITIAERNADTIMPGYTHAQHAQVTTYAHYLLSCADNFLRSLDGLCEAYVRVNLSPLGANALSGTSFKIDRTYTAKLLGFDGIVENTIDAVSSRDFAQEVTFWLATIMVTMSRIAENLVWWSTYEFNMVELADEFTDTSTAMPQKKNADSVELIRGKTGEVISSLMELLIMEKGLPIGYNKDLQETKFPLWRSIDTVKASTKILTNIFETLIINKERMKNITIMNDITAIDLAEFIVKKNGLSFREAHYLVGNIVKELIGEKKHLSDLTPDDVKKISKRELGREIALSERELRNATNPTLAIMSRISTGGPAPDEVQRMIEERKKKLMIIEE
jgi:argininosuccinate lyase